MSSNERPRLDWSHYVPVTAIEVQLLTWLIENPDFATSIAFNEFERQFLADVVQRYQEPRDEDGFYLSHRQRLTLWKTLMDRAHLSLSPEMYPVFEQVSAIAAACYSQRKQ
jgi:hypothetical protein